MRLIVMSDSHGNFNRVRRIVEENKETAQCFVHLGDGLDEFEDVHRLNPDLYFVAVKGNNDWGSLEQKERTIVCGGKNLLLSHGDLHKVKYDLLHYRLAAQQAEVDIALFGHTHTPCNEYSDELWLLNPGSVAFGGCYMALDITAQGIVPIQRTIQ